jgi:hypothetical protein
MNPKTPDYNNPDYRIMHMAWATLRYARTTVDPEEYATAVDWRRVERELAARLTAHGAELPPEQPEGENA